jgi:hypothetical protein
LDQYYLGIKIEKRKKWKRIGKGAILVLLLLLVISSIGAVITNLFDIPCVFNPSPPVVWRYFELDYPQNSPNEPSLRIFVNLTTSGNFVQGQPITMDVGGTFTNELLWNLTSVYPYGYEPNSTSSLHQPIFGDTGITVGFAGAPLTVNALPLFPFPVNSTQYIPQYSPTGSAVELILNTSNPDIQVLHSLGNNVSAITQTIVWTAQGDYHPEISFLTGNIMSNNTQLVDQIYDNIIIHIDSSDTLQAARYNRIDEVVSVVLVIFVLVEASKLIYEYWSKKN